MSQLIISIDQCNCINTIYCANITDDFDNMASGNFTDFLNDYDNITSTNYTNTLSICTNIDDIDKNIPTLLLTVPYGLPFFCLIGIMIYILIKRLITNK